MTNVSKNVMIVESMSSKFAFVKNPSIEVPKGMMLVEGVLGVANTKNRNNRYYTLEEYKHHIESFSNRIVEENGVFGEMEHPKSMNINLHNVSHKVLEVRLDENTGEVKGKLLLLDTPTGQIAQSIVRSGSSLPISSRALGSVNEKTGETTLSYLSTWDLVGTAGFKEANVQAITNESYSSGSMIVESAIYGLNDAGVIVENANGIPNIANALTESKINKMIAEAIKEDRLRQISENSDIDDILLAVDERFQSVYADAIEKWVTEDYTGKLSQGIQTWITEHFAPVIENWIVTEYSKTLSDSIERWITEEYQGSAIDEHAIEQILKNRFVPSIAKGVEKWITEEYQPIVSEATQNWLANEYQPIVSEATQNWLANEYQPIVSEATQTWMFEEAMPNVDKTGVNTIAVQSKSNVFKSKILESIDSMIEKSENVTENIEKPKEKIDESVFKGGPVWLQLIPEEFKQTWNTLNEAQQEQIYRRAAIRDLKTRTDIDVFWKSINFSRLVENAMPASIRRQINEGAAEKAIPAFQRNVFKVAKAISR